MHIYIWFIFSIDTLINFDIFFHLKIKERKLRERSEEFCRQLQMEVRSRTTSDLGSSSSLGMSSDSSRMEVERLEVSNQQVSLK